MTKVQTDMFPEDIQYTREHIWARPWGRSVEIGISRFAEQQLGEIVFVNLPAPGTHCDAGAEFGTVESLKSVSSLYCPYAGEIVAINSALEDTPDLINKDPYGKGWIIKVVCEQPEKTVPLLDAQAYRELTSGSTSS